MGLTVERLQKEEDKVPKKFTVTERLYKDKDGNVVPAGDPDAHALFKRKGAKISMEEAERLGLTGGKKMKTPSKNKMKAPEGNKSSSGGQKKAAKRPPSKDK